MRNKVAKKLKMEVALAMYVGEGVSEEDVRKDKKSVFASSDFKPVYRGRKKNYHIKPQVVNHMLEDTNYDHVARKMFLTRVNKSA